MSQQSITGRVAEIKIKYSSKISASERPKVTGSQDAERILRPLFEEFIEHREAMYALYLDRSNRVKGSYLIGLGGVAGVVADPKLIFQAALKCHASGIILVHNHPSGNDSASHADIEFTRKIRNAATLLDIQLHDHLIILPNFKYLSFADEGLL